MTILGYAVAGIFVALLGAVLGAPYNFLSGGSANDFISTATLMPYAVAFLLFVWAVNRQRSTSWWKRSGGWSFWLAVLYVCQPILFNGISILLRLSGCLSAGSFIFRYRYWGILGVPGLLLAILLLCIIVMPLWTKRPGVGEVSQ